MNEPVKYVKIGSYDEGSWDNCAIELRLSRRTDWASNTTIIDLCSDAGDLEGWKDILVSLGFNATHVESAINGGTVGNPAIDIDKLDNYLNKGEIELYYLSQIKKL